MSSRKKWGGWNSGPKLDEARVIAPEVAPPPRAKKDRRHWCRGKVGIAHDWTIQVNKSVRYRAAAWGRTDKCGWQAKHTRNNYSDGWRWEPTGEWTWHCNHEHVCKNCGKILEPYGGVGKECPTVRPPVPAECKCYSCRVR